MLKDHLSFNACANVIASQKSLALFVCMVAPILKDHLNTNACVSVIVRAKRAEGCLRVCVWGGWWCVCCVYGGPHIEGPPQNQCKCLSLRVKSQREAESMAIH